MENELLRNVAIVALPGAEALEVSGPFDVFRRAAYFAKEDKHRSSYSIAVASLLDGPIGESGNLQLISQAQYHQLKPMDTLLLVGGFKLKFLPLDQEFRQWLVRTAKTARRVCGICAGAFGLAESGLLSHRKAVCHWGHEIEFRQRYPEVLLDANPIFLRDGHLYTSAGVTAGMDLSLALVEEDMGRALALKVARSMVMFLRRPGTQSQFSNQLAIQQTDKKPIRELQEWINDHLHGDLRVRALAARVGMSQRNFTRVFSSTLGVAPSFYVERLRVDAARRRLEESDAPLKIIAAETGLGTMSTMGRSFERVLGTSPTAYRASFSTSLIR